MPAYNKLVRDLIPDIIRRNGGVPACREVTDEEFRLLLPLKLSEEANELFRAQKRSDIIGEFADLKEVSEATALAWGIERQELDRLTFDPVLGEEPRRHLLLAADRVASARTVGRDDMVRQLAYFNCVFGLVAEGSTCPFLRSRIGRNASASSAAGSPGGSYSSM